MVFKKAQDVMAESSWIMPTMCCIMGLSWLFF
jgi:hypothetical protein